MCATKKRGGVFWLWALLPLLLAAALSIPLLNIDAFNGDEVRSLFAAGVLPAGPHTLTGVWDMVALRSAEQALGWPSLLFVQGHIFGWSEPAVRMLPVYGGLLTLALLYRVGRDLLTPPAGLFAALLLAASTFFLAYMIHARAFTLVAFCATLCVWCYWRVALRPRAPGRAAQAGLLLGATGMLYLHYVGSLLLPALGLYHLLFAPKNRRWWRPLLLLGLAVLAAAPQLPVFLEGLGRTLSNEKLDEQAMAPAELLSRLLRFMSNGAFQLSPTLSAVTGVLLLVAFVAVILLRLRQGPAAGPLWLLVFVPATMLLLLLVINELLSLVPATRIRYLMPLWPLTALLAGAGLHWLAGRQRRLVATLLALWLLSGAWLTLATDFRYELGFFFRTDLHRVYRVARERIPATDLLILDRVAGYRDREHIYTRLLNRHYVLIKRGDADPLASVTPVHKAYPWVWLLYLTANRADIMEQVANLGRVRCELALERWEFTLERYALSATHCPESPTRLTFEAGIGLTGPDIRLEDGRLRLHAGLRSADDALLARYSLAVHVIDARSGERVAQDDTGVGPGSFVPLRSEIDLRALPAGEYEVHLALYDWQTGARLTARDLETGAVSDMHTLHRFRSG